jgi:GrpB-like predicted nucleotidyltransferase (UPF0157 family)
MALGSYFISDYDAAWCRQFLEEKAVLETLPFQGLHIEHVGSTSIPGLGAKPIIDIMMAAGHPAEAVLEELRKINYVCDGSETVPGTFYCRKERPYRCNLHLTDYGRTFWNEKLLFRDYLRAHPEAAWAYDALKREILANLGPDPSRPIYNQRKEKFILYILERAKPS